MPGGAASTLAHEMGHNLGFEHDDEIGPCDCDDPVGKCIMESYIKSVVLITITATTTINITQMMHGSLWRRQGGGGGEASPLWVDVQKLCNMCVLLLSWTFSYHTTNTLQGRRAKSHVDTQTIQPGLGDFVL